MIKLTKKQMIEKFLKGETIILCTSKIRPNGLWGLTNSISLNNYNKDDIEFENELNYLEKRLNSFSYYNCTKETGLRINYYIYE